MQTAETGHFIMEVDGYTFNLTASLKNIAKITDSKRILDIYDSIHSPFTAAWYKIDLARDVFVACSDSQLISKYLVKTKNMKPHYNTRCISSDDQVLVAAALLRHGVAGVNRPKSAGKSSSKPMTEFDINKVVADAKKHFNMSLSEAWGLTMTEFYIHLAATFPPETSKDDAPSMEAHKAAMKAAMERK